jgi:hypothetical protein
VVFWPLDDIELVDWTPTNKFAIYGFVRIFTTHLFSNHQLQDDSNKKNQFVGFVSSHKKGTLLTSFHIHSFVVFHADLQENNTIVTCILTA